MSGEVKLRKKLDYESLATLNQTLMSLEIEVVSRGRLGDPTETRRKRTKVTVSCFVIIDVLSIEIFFNQADEEIFEK